jgi:uncharacterized delta-60 repeat protein
MINTNITNFNKCVFKTIIIAAFLFMVLPLYSQQVLDPTFGTAGTVMSIIGDNQHGGDQIYKVIILPNGKILAIGKATYRNDVGFAIARYNQNGSIDSTFGDFGNKLTYFSNSYYNIPYSAALQSNGKILLAGEICTPVLGGQPHFAVLRYTEDGRIDSAFGNNGFVVDSPDHEFGTFQSVGSSIAVLPDNKFIVAGNSVLGSYKAFTLIKYQQDGKRDSTFGLNGVVRNYIKGGSETGDYCYKVLITGDGKIIAAGTSYGYTQFGRDAFALARYNSNGTIDTTFGNSGFVRAYVFGSTVDNSYSCALSAILQPDGKILAGGYLLDSVNHYSYAVARFNSNGSLDNTFGPNGGTITTHIYGNSSNDDYANDLALQSDGKIILVGSSGASFSAARFTKNGFLDNSFGNNGTVMFNINGSANNGDAALSVAVQPDDKIIIGGMAKDYSTNDQFALARLNSFYTGINESNRLNSFSLEQNYPNPFNPSTTISFSLDKETKASLKVYDMLGKEIAEIVNSRLSAGQHEYVFNASKLSSGVYFYTLTTETNRKTCKMVILK